MKKMLFIVLCMAGIKAAEAQTRKIDSTRRVNPVIDSRIKQRAPATTATQNPAAVISNAPTAASQTATGILYTPPPALPDIIITQIAFAPNSANTYAVQYTLKNVGTSPVKKGLLSVQSYINGGAAGGSKSFTLVSETNQLVNPGESVSSSSTFSTSGIIPGNTYNFSMNVNGGQINTGTSSEKWVGQQFEELNYSNNTFQSNFVIPPPPPAPADILVVITGISKTPTDTSSVRIYYTLKNIGETAIPPTASLSLQSRVEDTDNNPATFLQTACCGQATGGGPVEAGAIPFAPGEIKESFWDARVAGGINFPTLPKNVLYQFNIVISGAGFIEGNSANNKSSYNYLLQ